MPTDLSPAPLTDFSQDKLNLGSFAEDLTNIVRLSLPHPTNENSKVIALDSGWGTGKTSFIYMWTNKLNTDPKYSNKFICVTYNAWENDDSSDALVPILCRFQQLVKPTHDDTMKLLKEVGALLIKLIGRPTHDDAMKLLEKVGALPIKLMGWPTHDDAMKLLKECLSISLSISLPLVLGGFTLPINGKIQMKSPDMILDEFSARQERKQSLEKLINAIRAKDKYLIICIDELDRCRPTFAIETLEVVKHFFDIPNVVFVFSLDMNQLQNSIKTIYGDIDSMGYLQRFFDYRISLPKRELESFLKDRLEKLYPPHTDYEKEQCKWEITWLSDIARQYPISLRSLNNICIVYAKFKRYVLHKFDWGKRNWKGADRNVRITNDIKNDENGQWYYFKTYLTFIVMKYFCPDEYWSFIQNGTNFDGLEKNKYEKVWHGIFGVPSKEGESVISSYTKDIVSLTPDSLLWSHSNTVHPHPISASLSQARYRLLVGCEINMVEYQDLQLPTFIDKIIEDSLLG